MSPNSPTSFGPAFSVPPPRRTGGKVLYLDVDGVVHPSEVYWFRKFGPRLVNCAGHALFEHCELLDRELQPYPEVRIVISSSWVVHYRGSLRRIASNFTPGLRARVIGATFHTQMNREEFVATPRGVQIWEDVVRRQPTWWLALDDDAFAWPAWCRSRLVLTDALLGLASPSALADLRKGLQELQGS